MDVTIETGWGTMPAFVRRPSVPGPWPGVVIIHDVFGSGENLQRHAAWLADCGYLAIAPDRLYWSKKFACIRAVMVDMTSRKGRTFEEIEAARAWLSAQSDCTGRNGVIGFCMGGSFALLLAPRGQYEAAAPNYGHVPKNADTFFAGACPIVASFGRKDPALIGAAGKLERALTANGVEHDVKLYPHASHGFLDDHTREVPLPLLVLMKVLNVGYHGPSADDARARIQAFFDRHLKS